MTKLAILRDHSADPILHAQARPVIGTQQFILPNKDNTVAFPVFLQRNNGRIQRFIMMRAFVNNPMTNAAQRSLQDVWLLIPGNPRISVGQNGETYFGDQSEGMIYAHLRATATGKSGFNSMTAMCTIRNMPIVPNKKYGASNFMTSMVELATQHASLCGGKSKDKDTGVISNVEPLMPNTEAFDAFMQAGLVQTEKFLGALIQNKMYEPNLVFEVLPSTIQMGNVPFYRSELGEAMLSGPHTGIRRFSTVSSWNGAVKINTGVNRSVTGNGQELQHGIRETGGRYMFDRIGTIYDRRLNQVEARVSMIDPVTIRYLEGAQQHDAAGEDEGIETNISTNNRKSRAKVLEEVAKELGYIQFLNAELKVYPNGSNPDSMAITVEMHLVDHSSYAGIRDTSKLGNVASAASESDMVAAMMNDDFTGDFEAIMSATTSLTKIEEGTEAPAPAAPAPVGTDMDDELPF